MLFANIDAESITKDDEAAFRFAVEFAQVDLYALSPAPYLAMLRSLRAFIYRDPSHALSLTT